MLLIRRRAGESFFVGDCVQIRIVELSGNRVVLGIVAPPEVSIMREEIRQAAEQNQQAARTISTSVAAALAAKLRQNSVR